MSDKKTDYSKKYSKWIEKRISGKPAPVQKFLRCSYNSGMMVLTELDGIPFSKLSSSLYFLCQDMKTEQLSRKYEALLELAGASPDRFMTNIHKELNGISRYIKENDLLPEFCEFISACDRLRCVRSTSDMDVRNIMTAYMDLLMQTCTYLNPSRFNFLKRFCGCSTSNEILLCEDYYPYADDVAAKISERRMMGKTPWELTDFDSNVADIAKKIGYTSITSYTDLEQIMMQDIFYTAQISCLITYINEYTYDMLPDTKHLFNRNVKALSWLQIYGLDFENVKISLTGRSRTLPSNGVLIEFSYDEGFAAGDQIQSLMMKEILHDDRIVMLYKVRISDQELCGYYDTKDDFFHSLFLEVERVKDMQSYHEKLQSIVLYLYAAATGRDGDQAFLKFKSIFFSTVNDAEGPDLYPISVNPYYRGGRLRNTYLESDRLYNPTGSRLGNDKYEWTERSVQGYIRKVGTGRTPSKEAVARAEELGFSLEPDETYVQPFTRHILRLKRKD